MMNNLTVGLVVLVAILGGFYVGAKVGQNQAKPAAAVTTTTAGGGAGGGGAGGAGAGSAITGRVVSVSGNTLTILNRATGQNEKIDISSARITKTVQGAVTDVQQDQNVTVVGQAGPGGTIQATVVSVGGGFGGGRGQPAGTPSP